MNTEISRRWTACFLTLAFMASSGCGDASETSNATTPTPPPTSSTSQSVVTSLVAMAANSPHVSMGQFKDGTSGTLLGGTVAESRSIPWTKPEDIRFGENFPEGENRFVGGYFMFCDGSVRNIYVEEEIDISKFRGLFTIAGSEIVNASDLYPPDYVFPSPPIDDREAYISRLEARSQTGSSLKTLVGALHQYHDKHGHFPPGTVYGPDGSPWHSWRVLILPFLGQQELYDQYDHTVPWDHGNNKVILNQMPDVYVNPLYKKTDNNRTGYLAISGPGTAFPTR